MIILAVFLNRVKEPFYVFNLKDTLDGEY